MHITHMDKEREAQLAKDREYRFDQKLHTQVGLRWNFEAMIGAGDSATKVILELGC